MNRRNFLQICFRTVGAVALAPLVKFGTASEAVGIPRLPPRLPGQGKILNMGVLKKNCRGGWTFTDWFIDMADADKGAAALYVDDKQEATVCGYSLDELRAWGMASTTNHAGSNNVHTSSDPSTIPGPARA